MENQVELIKELYTLGWCFGMLGEDDTMDVEGWGMRFGLRASHPGPYSLLLWTSHITSHITSPQQTKVMTLPNMSYKDILPFSRKIFHTSLNAVRAEEERRPIGNKGTIMKIATIHVKCLHVHESMIALIVDSAPASPRTPPQKKRTKETSVHIDPGRKYEMNCTKAPPKPPIMMAALLHSSRRLTPVLHQAMIHIWWRSTYKADNNDKQKQGREHRTRTRTRIIDE